MRRETSHPNENAELFLQVEANQPASSQDVTSGGGTCFLWRVLGCAVLLMIAISAWALLPLASHASAKAPHAFAFTSVPPMQRPPISAPRMRGLRPPVSAARMRGVGLQPPISAPRMSTVAPGVRLDHSSSYEKPREPSSDKVTDPDKPQKNYGPYDEMLLDPDNPKFDLGHAGGLLLDATNGQWITLQGTSHGDVDNTFSNHASRASADRFHDGGIVEGLN
jgi:hypothetical protein